jgi:hypothetical protein
MGIEDKCDDWRDNSPRPIKPRDLLTPPGLNAGEAELERLGVGEFDEDACGRHQARMMARNSFETPEQAFRRGMQQGAHRVLDALQKAGGVDAELLKQISNYVGITLFDFRYPYRKGRRLGRCIVCDEAPWLELIR